MDPTGRSSVQINPPLPSAHAGSPSVDPKKDPIDPSAKGDAVRLSGAGRGVTVEVITQFLWFKDKQVFSLTPSPDGQVVFSQYDGKGDLRRRQAVGMAGGPVRMDMDVQAGMPPFFSKKLRVEIRQEQGESSVRVTDLKTGRLLKEATM
jgi:hypothetical protein